MRVSVVTLGLGGHYPRGVTRLIQSFAEHNPGVEVQAWVNTLPPGAPERVIVDAWDYTGYCAKPFAMKAAMDQGADIVIWMDASVRAIRGIQPLVDHIERVGYYMAPTGFTIGEWSSDEALAYFGVTRVYALDMKECASGIVGVARGNLELIERWRNCRWLIPGHHSNSAAADKKHHYKNVGFVSNDPRCSGHRQDQTVLSLLAHQLGLTDWVPWPKFVAYKAGYSSMPGQSGAATEETCLLIEGL